MKSLRSYHLHFFPTGILKSDLGINSDEIGTQGNQNNSTEFSSFNLKVKIYFRDFQNKNVTWATSKSRSNILKHRLSNILLN